MSTATYSERDHREREIEIESPMLDGRIKRPSMQLHARMKHGASLSAEASRPEQRQAAAQYN